MGAATTGEDLHGCRKFIETIFHVSTIASQGESGFPLRSTQDPLNVQGQGKGVGNESSLRRIQPDDCWLLFCHCVVLQLFWDARICSQDLSTLLLSD